MKKLTNILFVMLTMMVAIVSCKKETPEISDLDKVRKNNNAVSYPVTKMDSAQAIAQITKQKIQELLDLSTLYTSGNRDTEIDSVIYSQMKSYFIEDDSAKLAPILTELDSFNVKMAKVGNIEVSKTVVGNDTIDFAKFAVEYFDDQNKSVGIFERNAKYVLEPSPVKFKKEFKFYFVSFEDPVAKDTTSVGVTK